MSERSVLIDSDAINRYLAERILESALGERLHETVEQALKQLGSYGNDPLKSAVFAEVQKHVRECVSDEFAATIRTRVREKMTDEYIDDLVARAIQQKPSY